MATVAKKLITAEEFAQLPDPADGSQQELVRGEIVTMPPPKGRHGVCCSKAVRRVGNFVDDHAMGIVVCNDTGFILERDPDTVRGPDISFWSRQRLPVLPEEYIAIPPDLAIEVISPSDVFSVVQRRVREFLASGVRLVWLIDPENRAVTVYRKGRPAQELEESDELTGEDILPGFVCKVADLLP
jgi:Uma2 family endonuclease